MITIDLTSNLFWWVVVIVLLPPLVWWSNRSGKKEKTGSQTKQSVSSSGYEPNFDAEGRIDAVEYHKQRYQYLKRNDRMYTILFVIAVPLILIATAWMISPENVWDTIVRWWRVAATLSLAALVVAVGSGKTMRRATGYMAWALSLMIGFILLCGALVLTYQAW